MNPRPFEAPAAGGLRLPAVAGSFYPAHPDTLRAMVTDLLAAAARLPAINGRPTGAVPAGLLVPHAGLVYSGVTAAAAWGRLVAGTPGGGATGAAPAAASPPPIIVILGTNHGAAWLDGVGVWPTGAWRTPLGDVPVDEDLAAAIVELGPPFRPDAPAHLGEHSIEVQLPLVQACAPDARIVPLAVSAGRGTLAIDAGRRLGALLARRRAAGDHVVLAISTDMAHYPPAAACERTTAALLPSILALDAAGMADREAGVRDHGGRDLACGMCGIEAAILGLSALGAMGVARATHLASATSADAGGPADRTVGYLAVRFDARPGPGL